MKEMGKKRLLYVKYVVLTYFIIWGHFAHCQQIGAELISHQTHLHVEDGKLTKEIIIKIKINNLSGEQFTAISLPYSSLNKISNVEAHIEDESGRIIRLLNKKDFIERNALSESTFYQDEFVKEFKLTHNVYPYVILYKYKLSQNEFIHLHSWFPWISNNVPTHSAILTLDIPAGYEIMYKNISVNEPAIKNQGLRKIYQWTTNYIEPVKSQAFSPSLLDFLPSVIIIPKEFYYDKRGSFKDWVSFGNWQHSLISDLNTLPDTELSKIKTIVGNITDKREMVRLLYHYLQDETRYINVNIETGGLKPYPSSYVAYNKYGDCKALSYYFKSVLESVNIPSFYSKVYAGHPSKIIDKSIPSQQSNHIILCVPLENDTLWLDCTSKAAFNFLGTFTQNRDAFLICQDKSTFVKTPMLQYQDVLVERKISFSQSLLETYMVAHYTLRGELYEKMIGAQKLYNKQEIKRYLDEEIIPSGSKLSQFKILELHRDSAKCMIDFEASSQKVFEKYGNELVISVLQFSLPEFEKPELRKLTVQIDYPIYEIDTLTYDIPEGYSYNEVLDTLSIANTYGEYTRTTSLQSNKLNVAKSIRINAGHYSLSDYHAFYTFYRNVMNAERKKMILTKNK